MIIKTAQYYKNPQSGEVVGIKFTTDEEGVEHSVLLNSTDNIHYKQIQKQVADGTLTIQEAD
jgi:hypothetical protein